MKNLLNKLLFLSAILCLALVLSGYTKEGFICSTKNYQNVYEDELVIGNRYDISIRAIKILQLADTLICEDTRVTKKLFNLLNISIKEKKWISYNDHSTDLKRRLVLNEIKQNKVVCFISDAGTPLISDPGYKLVNFIINNGDRIAQMILCPVIKMKLEEAIDLPKTIRGQNGFGSTGK